MRTIYIVGNWKMNHSLADIKDFFGVLKSEKFRASCESWVAPQFIHLERCLTLAKEVGIKIGAQNCSHENKGAFTGDVSSTALKDLGAHFVIIGHSERRSVFNETNEFINSKIQQAVVNKLTVIFCVGETLEQREANKTFDILQQQLVQGLSNIKGLGEDNLLIAYEPVWAIGTGKTATPQMADQAHGFIRETISKKLSLDGQKISILYGGSVKPDNVSALLAKDNIDGGLVGGASLKSSDFRALTQAASN